MLDGIENLIEMSLRLNRSTPIFQTKRELRCIARIPRARREQRLGRNRPIHHMLVKRTPEEEVFVFRILYAVNLDFLLLTSKQSDEKLFRSNGAKPNFKTKTTDKKNKSHLQICSKSRLE